jgi:hypothetical protein
VGPDLWRRIRSLIKNVWNKEEIPVDWKTGIVCSVCKYGDRNEYDSYKGITLLSCIHKVLSNIISNNFQMCSEV